MILKQALRQHLITSIFREKSSKSRFLDLMIDKKTSKLYHDIVFQRTRYFFLLEDGFKKVSLVEYDDKLQLSFWVGRKADVI